MRTTAIALAATLLMVGCGSEDAGPAPSSSDTGTTDTGSGDTGMDDTGSPDTGGSDSAPPDTGGDTKPPLPTGRIDRVGRPAINTALTPADLKDGYNKTETFGSKPSTELAKAFNDSLIFIDMLDGKADWTLKDGVHPLRDPLLLDVLIVDTGKPCPDKGSYLDVELFVLGLRATPNTTCGGRTLNDDVMDTTLTATVTALKSPVKDNVDKPTKPATAVWPYLQPPN